jgi:hypothetical protein
MSRPTNRQRVDRAFGRGGAPTPYGRRANNFQDTWNTLRSSYGRSSRAKRKPAPVEYRFGSHRNTLS